MSKSITVLTLIISLNNIISGQNIDSLIDVGGYNLHFNIIQDTGLPIIFESGAGDDGTIWESIIKQLDSLTDATLITYDRSGFGKSGNLDHDLNIEQEIIGLEIGLKNLGYLKPCILVAHSYGGFCSLLFANRNPDLVKGYIAIDANLPCTFHKGRVDLVYEEFNPIRDSLKTANIGLHNLALSMREDVEILKKLELNTNLPIFDIVAEYQYYDSVLTLDCHKKFCDISPERELITATDCNHYIFFDNPKLIIEKIMEMYNKQVSIMNINEW